MFKDKYKEAHNSVVPDKELLRKIIKTADCELKKKTVVRRKISFYPYLYAAAAVLMITASITGYNALKPHTNETNIIISENKEIKNIQTAKKEEKTEKMSVKEEAKEEVKDAKSVQTSKANKNEAATVIQKEVEVVNDSLKMDAVTVLWNVNEIIPNDAVMQRSLSLAADEIPQTQSVYEELSLEKYEEYIGIKAKNAEVPDDMTLLSNDSFQIEKDSQTGEIINDENTYYFESSYDRFIMISLTTKKEECESFLNDESMQKSSINNSDVVVTQTDGIYNAYFLKDNTGIKITAGKIDEKELQNTITSLLK